MKEQTIYFQDSRGVIRSMSSQAYEKLRIGRSGESVKAEREDSGNTESLPAGERATEAHNQESLPELETGKKTYATNETLKSSPDSGTDSIGTTERHSRRNQKTPDNWGV